MADKILVKSPRLSVPYLISSSQMAVSRKLIRLLTYIARMVKNLLLKLHSILETIRYVVLLWEPQTDL